MTRDYASSLLGGREFVTVEDAETYITKLAKAKHEAPEWRAAIEALIVVASSGGPTMLARIARLRTLNRRVDGDT